MQSETCDADGLQGVKEIVVDRDPAHGGVGLVCITPEMTAHICCATWASIPGCSR